MLVHSFAPSFAGSILEMENEKIEIFSPERVPGRRADGENAPSRSTRQRSKLNGAKMTQLMEQVEQRATVIVTKSASKE